MKVDDGICSSASWTTISAASNSRNGPCNRSRLFRPQGRHRRHQYEPVAILGRLRRFFWHPWHDSPLARPRGAVNPPCDSAAELVPVQRQYGGRHFGECRADRAGTAAYDGGSPSDALGDRANCLVSPTLGWCGAGNHLCSNLTRIPWRVFRTVAALTGKGDLSIFAPSRWR